MKVLCLISLVLFPFLGNCQREVELIFPSAVQIGASVSKLERDSAVGPEGKIADFPYSAI